MHLSHIPGRLAQKYHHQPTSKRVQFQYYLLAGKSHSLWSYHHGLLTRLKGCSVSYMLTSSAFMPLTITDTAYIQWALSCESLGKEDSLAFQVIQRCSPEVSTSSPPQSVSVLGRPSQTIFQSEQCSTLHYNSHEHRRTNGAALTLGTFVSQ